jgi:hypothetical protein
MQIYKNIPLGIFYLKIYLTQILEGEVLAKANRIVFKIKNGLKPVSIDINALNFNFPK